MADKRIIAIDIDDVIAATTESMRLWANAKSGVTLTEANYRISGDYWGYYEQVWAANNLAGVLNYDEAEALITSGEVDIPLIAGAGEAIFELQKQFKIILVTSRPPEMEAMTKGWIVRNFAGEDVELYLAVNHRTHPDGSGGNRTKGELCVELGAFLLIDDNVQHCKSALDQGLESVLFGDYGWQKDIPDNLMRCKDWPAVLEQLHGLR